MSELRKCQCGTIVGKEDECCEGARPDTASDAQPRCPSCLASVSIKYRCTFKHDGQRCMTTVCFGCYGWDRLCPQHRELLRAQAVPQPEQPEGER